MLGSPAVKEDCVCECRFVAVSKVYFIQRYRYEYGSSGNGERTSCTMLSTLIQCRVYLLDCACRSADCHLACLCQTVKWSLKKCQMNVLVITLNLVKRWCLGVGSWIGGCIAQSTVVYLYWNIPNSVSIYLCGTNDEAGKIVLQWIRTKLVTLHYTECNYSSPAALRWRSKAAYEQEAYACSKTLVTQQLA